MNYPAPIPHETARYRDSRLSPLPPLGPADTCAQRAVLTAVPAVRFQVIEGFGGAFTEAAAVSWQRLGDEQQTEFLRSYFDTDTGNGYRLCRLPMGSCDFALGNYSHVDVAGDVTLRSFSLDRDRAALIPLLRAATEVAGQPLRLLASPWSPPAWMKSTGAMNGGGRLRPEYREAWARYFVKFIEAYEAEGIPIWGVSVQNEPEATQRWDSCLHTPEEERDFVRDFLGPALHGAGRSDIRIVIWDHNRDRMVHRAATVLSDPQAASYVWGTGFHWYGADHFDHVQLVHDAWPDKHLLFTEGCQEGGPHHGSWDLGERYARSMINDINRWTVGWIDWNLGLDDEGGPNHVGNFCSAPVLMNPSASSLSYQSSYYYIGHFSRFAKPGARRILCASDDANLEVTGFCNPDGTLAIVVLNRTESERPLVLQIGEQRWDALVAARSIVTYAVAGRQTSSG